jgi:putative nucleotidyltransferase with HDIG domain
VTREEALALVREFVKNEALVRHMLAVEAAMRWYAASFDEDPEPWGLSGLLHDFDWEIHPTLENHPQDGASILRTRGVPEPIVRCVLSHAEHTGVVRQSRMEHALLACDEITGLITAVALVRPSRSLLDMQVSSVRKKWKDGRFAANVRRDEIERGAAELGLDLWEHVGNVLRAMSGIASDLGLDGRAAVDEPVRAV